MRTIKDKLDMRRWYENTLSSDFVPAATDIEDTDDFPASCIGLHIQSDFLMLCMDGLLSAS